jgi:phage terminase large subunit
MTNKLVIDIPKMVDPAYYKLYSSKQPYIALKGARASGKSVATAFKVVVDILAHPYVNWLVVRQFQNTQKDSTFAIIKWAVHFMGLDDYFKFTVSPLEITYKPTQQKIFFRSMDDPLKITSITTVSGKICRSWWEEAYELKSSEAFQTVIESMRGELPAGGFYQHVITFNPWSDKHWLKREFFDVETRRKNTLAFTTTYKNNHHLNQDFIDSMEEMVIRNPNRAKVAVFGDWGISEGLVFDGLFEQRDFSMEEIANLPKAVGLDFGFKHDPTAGEFMAIDQKNRVVYVYDEFYQQGMLTQSIAQSLAQHQAFGLPIIADNADQRLITELALDGVPNIRPAGKGKDSVIQGIQFMQSYRFIIHPRVKGLLGEMNTYVYDKDKLGNWLNKPKDENNHAIDSLRYAMEPYTFMQGGQYMSYQERVRAVKNLGL